MEVCQAYHKVALSKAELLRQTFFRSILASTLNLVVVIVQPNDVDSSEFGNFSCWSSNAAPNVQNFHAVSQTHHMSYVMFVSSNGLVKAFAIGEAAKMERA